MQTSTRIFKTWLPAISGAGRQFLCGMEGTRASCTTPPASLRPHYLSLLSDPYQKMQEVSLPCWEPKGEYSIPSTPW